MNKRNDKDFEIVNPEKQFAVIKEAIDEGKSIGQVRIYAVDSDDKIHILNGIIYDEDSKMWKTIDEPKPIHEEFKDALEFFAGLTLIQHKLTCKYALLGKEVSNDMLAISIDLDEVIRLFDEQGFKVNRLSQQ